MAKPASPKPAVAGNKAANAAFSLDKYLAEGGGGSQSVTAIRATTRGNLVVIGPDGKEGSMFRKTLEKCLADKTFTKNGNVITAKDGFRVDQEIYWPKGKFVAKDVI